MKLDKDLVREVLLKLEADENDPRMWKEIEVPGFTREQIAYTVQKLNEAGMVEAHDVRV